MQSKRIITNFLAVLMIMLCAFLSGCGLDNLPQVELIDSSVSPNGKYTVNAYLCSGNATTDFSVRCEVVDFEQVNAVIFIGNIIRKMFLYTGNLMRLW